MIYTKKVLKSLVNTKRQLRKPTGTTTRNRFYKILGFKYPDRTFAEVKFINDNGRPISVLVKRFNID